MDTGNYKEIEEEVELTFRNQKFKIVHRCYINEETGEKFTTNKQDEDMMWTLFRAYWERKGFEHFYDIDGYREKQEPASEDLQESKMSDGWKEKGIALFTQIRVIPTILSTIQGHSQYIIQADANDEEVLLACPNFPNSVFSKVKIVPCE